jgi:hypothetical protein
MLKSFDIKKFDVVRREIFQKIAKPGTRLEGIKNLIRLGAFLTLMEASADVIKDLIRGRKVNISDTVLGNMFDLVISRYTRRKMQKEGFGTGLVQQVLPPFQAIDAIVDDIRTAGDKKGLEITKSIPLVGKIYYERLGKGAKRREKREEKGGINERKKIIKPKIVKKRIIKNTIRKAVKRKIKN